MSASITNKKAGQCSITCKNVCVVFYCLLLLQLFLTNPTFVSDSLTKLGVWYLKIRAMVMQHN